MRKAKRAEPQVVETHVSAGCNHPARGGGQRDGCLQGQDLPQVEIKPEMPGYYLGEFFITYKSVKHSRPGIGASIPAASSFPSSLFHQ